MQRDVIALSELPELCKSNSWEEIKDTCGSKAVHLAYAKNAGLPIISGFVITSHSYDRCSTGGRCTLTTELWDEIKSALTALEESKGLKFGGDKPLLLTVSGIVPTPGVVCVGVNDYTVRMLEDQLQDRGVAYDAYRRLIKSYGSLVYDIPETSFDDLQDRYCESRNIASLDKCGDIDFVQISKLFKSLIVKNSEKMFPQDAIEQLKQAISASMLKYSSEGGTVYRVSQHEYSKAGAAVIVSAVELGGTDEKSAVGVFSTHNLRTGALEPTGLFARTFFVEDAVEQMVTTSPISLLPERATIETAGSELMKTLKHPLTFEFVLRAGELFIVRLQPSKFARFGRFGAAVSMVDSKVLTKEEALSALCPADLGSVLNWELKSVPKTQVSEGAPGGYGAVSGIASHRTTPNCILVKHRVYPTDVTALISAQGCVARYGGDFSRGAHYVRSLCKPGAIGCPDMDVNIDTGIISTPKGCFAFGDAITLEGTKVFVNALERKQGTGLLDLNVAQVLHWVDEIRADKIQIQTVISNTDDFQQTIATGADGVGLFPIESLFGSDLDSIYRYAATRDETIAVDLESRLRNAVADFLTSAGPVETHVTVQLISKPLSSFLGSLDALTRDVATLKVRKRYEKGFKRDDELFAKTELLKSALISPEINPAFGLRGVHIGVIFPQFFAFQIRAIIEGAKMARRRGAEPTVRILVPGVSSPLEFDGVEVQVREAYLETGESATFGVVIESPRGCIFGGKIAEVAPVIYINTEALHAASFGYDMDNVTRSFLGPYLDLRLIEEAPYATIDHAVGQLIQLCVEGALAANPQVELGVCGSNCFDQKSMEFCHGLGIKSFCCEPCKVPVARLCAAQAILRQSKSNL
jgi:pyruvate,orthophosphate dikinase